MTMLEEAREAVARCERGIKELEEELESERERLYWLEIHLRRLERREEPNP